MFGKVTRSNVLRDVVKRHISITTINKREIMALQTKLAQPRNDINSFSSNWNNMITHRNHRSLSTLQSPKIKKALEQANGTHLNMVTKDESRDFMAVFPDIVRDLTELGVHTDIPEVARWYAKVLQYNVPNGKKIRGQAVVAAYKLIADPELHTEDNIRRANILGWCVEMVQAFFLVADDIMDNSETRRNSLCWYRNPGVGLSGINDAFLLECGIYSILKKHFSTLPCYVQLLEIFHEMTLKTVMGQSLDTMCLKDGRPQLELFTMKRYTSIVKYKTAYYTFQLPVISAMYLAGKYDPELHRQAKTVLLEMGHFFQVQDDFLSSFGDSEILGKKSTDIAEGKCSWLVVVALQRATAAQRALLEENYGRGVDNVEAEARVKTLYEELGLPNMYSIYEEETFNIIRTHIQQMSKGLPHELFFRFMNQTYKRNC